MAEAVTRTEPEPEPEPELELEPEPSVHDHPLDPISLAFGVMFAVVGAVFLFGDIDAASVSVTWVWAPFLAAIGLLLLAIGIRRHQRR